MSIVSIEYARFMNLVGTQRLSEDVCRLINIIHQNHLDLINISTIQGRRSKEMTQYLKEKWLEVPTTLHANDVVPLGNEASWTKLNKLVLGPFRGFVSQETFNLQKKYTLIYGANGAGKSSFCEALEFSLLGAVSEAESKRINLDSYFNNVWADTYVEPILTAINANNIPIPVEKNEESFRFCFIEKNRIDEFSRLASRTPAEKMKLIATLFGIDQFADFVKGFTESIDHHLNLNGDKLQQLLLAKNTLIATEQLITSETQKESAFRNDENNLAGRFDQTIIYEDLKSYIGSPENPGRLDVIRAKLEAPPKIFIGITRLNLDIKFKDLLDFEELLKLKKVELHKMSEKVSFQNLFLAVESLQSALPNKCPACDTPLQGEKSVVNNPYEKSKLGLAGLSALVSLQLEIKKLEEEISKKSLLLHGMLTKIKSQLEAVGLQIIDLDSINHCWWGVFILEDGKLWKQILEIAQEIESADIQTTSDNLERQILITERNLLTEIDREIIALESRKNVWRAEITSAREFQRQFDETNRQLRQEVEDERPIVILHQQIKQAYDTFLPKLKSYLADLPSSLLADLGDLTKDLYNSFNRDDRPEDLIAELWLPTEPDGIIEFAYTGTPTLRRDALQILSEGHIRCLGLALLIAKNIKQECPVLIFDDAVNAIDDDHRDGIWRTLFEDDYLGDKQIILTCHGQEFIKTIQQGLGAERVRDHCTYYNIFPHNGNHQPNVDTNPRTKNYILSAQNYLVRQDSRNALSEARKAIEGLAKKLWKWLGRNTDSEIKLKFDAPDAKPELKNMCDELLALLRKPTFEHAKKQALINAMTGLFEQWHYLNSGTHEEDRAEFNRNDVARSLEAIAELDRVLSS